MDDGTLKPPAPASILTRMRLTEPRGFILQVGFILVILAVAAFIVGNLQANGFDIAQTLISYPEDATYMRAFWVALTNTALLGVISVGVTLKAYGGRGSRLTALCDSFAEGQPSTGWCGRDATDAAPCPGCCYPHG